MQDGLGTVTSFRGFFLVSCHGGLRTALHAGRPGHAPRKPVTRSASLGIGFYLLPPEKVPRSGGGTHRAAFGGALTARELGFGEIWFSSLVCLYAALRRRASVAVFTSGASCPRLSMAREASTLSLVTCHAGFSRRGIDPVGETSNVPDTPLGSRHLVVSPPASANRRHPWSSQTKSRRSQKPQEASQAQQVA